MKAFAYALVPFLLADDKYKDLSYTEVLKKSEEMMKGHRMDYFVFCLSFIGWFLLAIPTLGLICIWLSPYYETARVKFLNDIKVTAEGGSTDVASSKAQSGETKVCPNCKTEDDASNEFCTNRGQKMK